MRKVLGTRINCKKMGSLLLTVIMLLACLSPLAAAATIEDVANNSLRIGNDIYAMSSDKLTADNIAASLAAGPKKVYFKFQGRWYDVYAATSASDIGETSKALADSTVTAWTGLNKWYKGDGSEDTITGSGATAAEHISSVIGLYGSSNDVVSIIFDTNLSAAPASSDLKVTRKVDGVTDTTALTKGSIGWSSTTPTKVTVNITPQVARGSAEKTVKYSVSYKNATAVEHTSGFPVAASSGPAAPTATINATTGVISGLSSSTTYEYRRATDTTWTTYNASSPPNYPGETIYIRVKASGTTPAGVIQVLTLSSSTSVTGNSIGSVTAVKGTNNDAVTVTFTENLTAAPVASDFNVSRLVNAVTDSATIIVGTINWSASSPKVVSFTATPVVASGPADKNVQYNVAYKGGTAVLQAVPYTIKAETDYIISCETKYVDFWSPFYQIIVKVSADIQKVKIQIGSEIKDAVYDGSNTFVLNTLTVKAGDTISVRAYDGYDAMRQEKQVIVIQQ